MNEIDAYKLGCISEEIYKKIDFLGKILNDEGGESSEMAGQQINKLLNEQNVLETDYLSLIQTRKQLKGFSNKEKLMETQNEIKDRAKRIKESTKKICRLFQDNKNVSDKEKIKKDMNFIKNLFATLKSNL